MALNLVLSDDLKRARKVVEAYPGLKEAFETSPRELMAVGLKEGEARALTSPELLEEADRALARVRKKGFSILTIEDEGYPALLKETFDPPYVLYCAGSVETLKEASVAVVGARQPSHYGKALAEKLSRELAARGLTVVSGLARGIDSMAHRGALEEGRTIAVLGSGLEQVYPPENKPLFRKIAESGVIISEFPLAAPPLAFHFPLRNRTISGLSLAVVVVEATKRSGSLITARLALEQNREVMAVPGNVTSALSQGTNWLIKAGAKLVETWEDVIEELPSPLREELLSQGGNGKERRPGVNLKEKEILACLKVDALTHIDEIAEMKEYSISELLALLLDLELKGYVVQSPGKYYQRRM